MGGLLLCPRLRRLWMLRLLLRRLCVTRLLMHLPLHLHLRLLCVLRLLCLLRLLCVLRLLCTLCLLCEHSTRTRRTRYNTRYMHARAQRSWRSSSWERRLKPWSTQMLAAEQIDSN